MLLLGVFAMTARNVTDPDVWWHLKTGELIAEHKTVPRTDPFSYTRAGQPWVAHEWLTELGMYELQGIAGFAGLILIFAVFLTAAFFLLYLRCGPSPYIAGIATLCAALSTAPIWGVRPQVLSLLLVSLWLVILERSERTPRTPLVDSSPHPPLGQPARRIRPWLGSLSPVPRRRFGRNPTCNSFPPTKHTSALAALMLVLDLLVVPLNPNGLRMFSYPIETLRSAAMQNYIAEWASPNFHRPEYWPLLLIILATFLALACSRSQSRPRDLILLSSASTPVWPPSA